MRLLLTILITGHGGRSGGGYMGISAPHDFFIGSGEVLTIVLSEELAGIRRVTHRSHLRINVDDGTINRATTTSVIPVLRPVLLDSSPRFTNVLEIRAAEVFMLLNVKPKIEIVPRSLAFGE